MNTITKRLSAFGVTGVAASALLIGGLAAPAQAAEPEQESNTSSSVEAVDAIGTGDNLGAARLGDADLNILTDALTGNTGGNLLIAPAVGDVASGNEVGNGTSVGNGTEVPVASGNDTTVTAPVEAPVEAPVDAPVDAPFDAPVEAPVGSSNDAALDGSGDVENTVDGALGGLNLGSVLGD